MNQSSRPPRGFEPAPIPGRRARRRPRASASWCAWVASAAWPAAAALAEPSAALDRHAELDAHTEREAQPGRRWHAPDGPPPLNRLPPGHPATLALYPAGANAIPDLATLVTGWVAREVAGDTPGLLPAAREVLERHCRAEQPLACALLNAHDRGTQGALWQRLDHDLVLGLCAAGDDEACAVGHRVAVGTLRRSTRKEPSGAVQSRGRLGPRRVAMPAKATPR